MRPAVRDGYDGTWSGRRRKEKAGMGRTGQLRSAGAEKGTTTGGGAHY